MDEQKAPAITWYRTPLAPDDRKRLHEKSDVLGGLQTFGFLGCYAFTLGASMYSFYHWHWEATVLLVFLHGMVASFMINAVHELTHGTVFETKALNVLFARVVAFLGWNNHEMFQSSHARHHRYTLHQPDDLEVVLPIHLMVRHFFLFGFIDPRRALYDIRSAVRIARGRFKGAWELTVFPESAPEKRKAPVNWARTLLLGHFLILVLSIALKLWLLPVLITFSPFYGGWLFFLCNNTQHIGLQDKVPDFRLCCRTFTLNPVVGFLYWRMNYHIEHHMYAAVPCYRLGELHRLIQHDLAPCPHGLVATWREIAAIQKIQEANPSYQHIAALPAAAS